MFQPTRVVHPARSSVLAWCARLLLCFTFVVLGGQKVLGMAQVPIELATAVPGWVTRAQEIRLAWRGLGAVEVVIGAGLALKPFARWPAMAAGLAMGAFSLWLTMLVLVGAASCGCGAGHSWVDRLDVALLRHGVLVSCWVVVVKHDRATTSKPR